MKKIFMCILAATLMTANVVAQTSGGKVLNVWSYNEELSDLITSLCLDLIPDDVELVNTVSPSPMYRTNVEEKINSAVNDPKMKADDKIDLYVMEPEWMLAHMNSNSTLDLKKTLGFTNEELASQFDYTLKMGTNEKGQLKGISYYVCPSAFAYRRSVALDVFGTDDPDEIQAMVSDWKKFENCAEKLADKNYKMLASYEDMFNVFNNTRSSPWVVKDKKGNPKLNIPKEAMEWVDKSVKLVDAGYVSSDTQWSWYWMESFSSSTDAFGIFAPEWMIDWVLTTSSFDSSSGDWAVCYGPRASYWGGAWMMVPAGCDNVDLVKKIMLRLTSEEVAPALTALGLNPNNKNVLADQEASDYAFNALNGQNPNPLFCQIAADVQAPVCSEYDYSVAYLFQQAMKEYIWGNLTKDQALENFKQQAAAMFALSI